MVDAHSKNAPKLTSDNVISEIDVANIKQDAIDAINKELNNAEKSAINTASKQGKG